jgi:hypothetical protein
MVVADATNDMTMQVEYYDDDHEGIGCKCTNKGKIGIRTRIKWCCKSTVGLSYTVYI